MQNSETSSVCRSLFCFCRLAATPKRENNTVCSLIAPSPLSVCSCVCCSEEIVGEAAAALLDVTQPTQKEENESEMRKHFRELNFDS